MLLRKLISDVEEENSRLSNLKLSLDESNEQVTTMLFLLHNSSLQQYNIYFKVFYLFLPLGEFKHHGQVK